MHSVARMRDSGVAPAIRREVARFVAGSRAQLIDGILAGRHGVAPRPNRFGEAPERLQDRVGCWLDLLCGALENREGARALFVGQTTTDHTAPDRSQAENDASVAEALESLRATLLGELAGRDPRLAAAAAEWLGDLLRDMTQPVDAYVETLLIGDCLMMEIGGLAAGQTARAGVGFSAFPVNARTAAQLAQAIDNRSYKAIFFSPFSHARGSELEALLRLSTALWSRARIDAAVERVIDQTLPLLSYLTSRFECPIYVHNAGLVNRTRDPLLARALAVGTARQRVIASRRINQWLKDFAAAANLRTRNQVQIIDEVSIVQRLGRWRASLYVFPSEFQHPTRLSFALAEQYAERIEMLARLHGRKLVICDLDNTLWDGVIGEGAVRHFVGRQQVLKRLRNNSGVVLSIASKNDPSNVSFTDGVLGEEDFVAPQISWGLKRDAVKSICKALNLQERHAVFIDDRPDERALVREASPDMQVLDATEARIWRQFALWADLIEGTSDLDRTTMYREQSARDSFLAAKESGADVLKRADVAAELGLKIEVRRAAAGDVKRVVELINRTNQWNLCGSRTTTAEINDLLAGGGLVLIGSAKDRFGDMGDVCVAVVREMGERRAEIPVFVLSCRVFGYGVETAVLNEVARSVDLGGRIEQLVGRYVSTVQNHIARNMYTDHGYVSQADGTFVLMAPAVAGQAVATA